MDCPKVDTLPVGSTNRIYDSKFSFPRILFSGGTVPNLRGLLYGRKFATHRYLNGTCMRLILLRSENFRRDVSAARAFRLTLTEG